MKKPFVLPAALLIALGASAGFAAPAALAQAPAAVAPAAPSNLGPPPWDQHAGRSGQAAHNARAHRDMVRDFAARAEARIAFIKTRLKITPAQESAFGRYAQAIRDNAAETQKSFADMRAHRGRAMNAVDRVAARAKFAQMHAQQEQRYLAAFQPLYRSLSADQKKIADELATPHGRFGHWGGPHRG